MREVEFQRQRRMVQRRLMQDPRFLLKIIGKSYAFYRTLARIVRQIRRLPLKQLPNAVLADWLERYVAAMANMWMIGVVPLYVELDLTDEIQRFVEERLTSSDAVHAMQVFMTPKKEGIVGEEHAALLRIALLPKSRQASALARHHQRYAWMANQLFTHEFFPIAYYRRRLAALTPTRARALLGKHVRAQRAHRRAFVQFMAELRPDRRMRTMIESLNEAIFWRSWRGEKPYETEYEIAEFFEEIGRRVGLKTSDLLYCLPDEIARWLRIGRAVPASVINARKAGFIFVSSRRLKPVLTGQSVKIWEERVAVKLSNASLVHGKTAFPGKVRGIARIVHGASELHKVQRGDVLITPSTTPMYTPVLSKIAAIVTEEGGVLSHASVISRELKIPCVIGTRAATKLFKDGDQIEVDATVGIVRKI